MFLIRSICMYRYGFFAFGMVLCILFIMGCLQKKEEPRPKAQTQKTQDHKIKILILGDSLTEGYGVQKDQAYPAQLEKSLRQQNISVQVINAGSSGSTTASAYKRLQWHLQSKPDILILALGGNDGLRGVDVTASYENLTKTIALAKEQGITVYLASMKLPYNYGERYRKDFEQMFQKVIQDQKIQEIPFILEGVGGVPAFNLPDGIHPNAKGHQIIAKNIETFLQQRLNHD